VKRFDFPLGPADTMTIRRVLNPPRVPNKGRAVYRMETALGPVLEENGWEFVSQKQKDRFCCYFRSPGGVISEKFNIHASIPTDEAILRLAEEFKRVASLPLGPGDGFHYEARIGPYSTAIFFPHGNGRYYYWEDPATVPKGTEWQWDMPPCMGVDISGVWWMYLFWPFGLDKAPEWQRHQYFSGLIHNLDYCGMPIVKQDEELAEPGR
jgi:hypothetical protein